MLFYLWEDQKESGFTEIILWYDPQLSAASILFSTSSGLTIGSGCSLMDARWQVFFFLSSLRANQFTLQGCNHWKLWLSCLLIWQEILRFSMQIPRTVCSIPGLPIHHLPPRACSNSCPWDQWCHPAILSSVTPFSSCLQSFPASGSFQMSQLFSPGGQSIGASG